MYEFQKIGRKFLCLCLVFNITFLSLPKKIFAITSQEQNAQLINNNSSDNPQKSITAPTLVYFVPGIGKVLLLATGVVIVGGVVYKAGSEIYNKV